MKHTSCTTGALLAVPGKPSVIAVVGCGGKTTFIENFAKEYRHQKVLITPTTRIYPVHEGGVTLCQALGACMNHTPEKGVQCLGIFNDKSGKLEALPFYLLEQIYGHYDLVLLEADGSRGLPCKGWLENEPVIPYFCTHTVGIVTMNGVGKTANEEYVLRLPAFLDLTGLEAGETITPDALLAMVCGPDGMFKNSVGKQYIFVNQVEDTKTNALAKKWLDSVEKKNPGRFSGLFYGSARANRWEEG